MLEKSKEDLEQDIVELKEQLFHQTQKVIALEEMRAYEIKRKSRDEEMRELRQSLKAKDVYIASLEAIVKKYRKNEGEKEINSFIPTETASISKEENNNG